MDKTYSRIYWKNTPNQTTPLDANNLNAMDYAVNEIDNRIVTLDTTKATKEELMSLVNNVSYDTLTGIITVNYVDGSFFTIDLNIEKIPVSFSLSDKGILKMVTEDGTEYICDIAKLIKSYSFEESNQIVFNVTKGDEESYLVSASIKANSITSDLLETNYLSDITIQANIAQSSAQIVSQKESNIISIEDSINNIKADIDDIKTHVDNVKESVDISEENANNYSENAKNSENLCLDYKNQTENDKNSVLQMKNTVSELKHLCESYEESANKSSSSANFSAISSSNSESNAKIYMDATKSYKDSAETSKSLSNYYMNNAKTAASEAITYQTNARNSASKAQLSEINSKQSEINAKSSEDYARTYYYDCEDFKEKASESAINAAKSESNTSRDAKSALNSERNAGAASESAKTYAEQAKFYYDRVPAVINEAISLNIPLITIDFTTGHLMYEGGRFDFNVNKETGHLMWEVG